jgi:hypothetical protein
MDHQFAVPTVRVASDLTDAGFVSINAADFDHDTHELFDKKDKHLLPARKPKVDPNEAASVDDLRKQLADVTNRALEAESDRDEYKVRAEAAEAQLEDSKGKKGGK